MSFRYSTGIGWDSHQIAAGRPLILGGVLIPAEFGLLGHSDADVLAHAVIDALFGAASMGDIGEHFPDTDEQYKDADSLRLLANASERIHGQGFVIEHVDATVIAEQPKLAVFKAMMCENLAQTIGLKSQQVNVKATTGEGIGFVGRGEGIAAMAVATLRLER